MLMEVLTGYPERLRSGKTVYVGDAHEPMRLATVRDANKERIVRFSGIETPEAAGAFRNVLIYVLASELPDLPEGEYYHHQLIGLTVVLEDGQPYGMLAEILETGANDVYVIKTPTGGEALLPAIEEVILEVNLEKNEMRVRPPEWRTPGE
jgi:16S rRNA processing protein RimM